MLDAIWMLLVLKGISGIYVISSPRLPKYHFSTNFPQISVPFQALCLSLPVSFYFSSENRQFRPSSHVFYPTKPLECQWVLFRIYHIMFTSTWFSFSVVFFFYQSFPDTWNPKCHGEKYHVSPNNLCSVIQYLSEVSWISIKRILEINALPVL